MGFVIGSFRAIEHLGAAGSGHRSSPFWRAEDARTIEDVALAVLPVEATHQVRDTVDSVAAIRHPHLLPVSEVVEDDTRVALVCPWPRGGRLIELVRRRGTLSIGETITVLLPVAGALAEVHRGGVRHGAVCPETIWFDSRGRPMLGAPAVGLAVGAVAGQAALGSADVAPEVLRQARTGPAGPAADIFSLGSVALFCLTGRSAWPADEPADVLVQSAAGQWPDPPDDLGRPEFVALLRSMVAPNPADRPAAERVVRLLTAGGSARPEPIRFGSGPSPTSASSMRWRGWSDHVEPSVDQAEPDAEPVADELLADGPAPGRTADPVEAVDSDPEPADARLADARPLSGSRSRGPLRRLAVAVLSGLLLTVLIAQVGTWLREPTDAAVSGDAAVAGDTAVAGDAAVAGAGSLTTRAQSRLALRCCVERCSVLR